MRHFLLPAAIAGVMCTFAYWDSPAQLLGTMIGLVLIVGFVFGVARLTR